MNWQEAYLARFYGSPNHVDGTTEFHAMCAAHIPSGAAILEVGAGPSNPTSKYLSSRGRLSGLDIDRAVQSNEYLAETTRAVQFIVPPHGPASAFENCGWSRRSPRTEWLHGPCSSPS